jgi:hypothetical protein
MWLGAHGSSHEQGRKGRWSQPPGNEESAFYKRADDPKGKTDSKKSIIVSPRQSLSRMPSARVDLTFSAESAPESTH